MSGKIKKFVRNFSDKFNRFSKSSGRETKEKIKEDRGAARRGAAVGIIGALSAGFQGLSDVVAVGAWGQTLAVWSTAGIIYLAADTALSVGETAVNVHKYNKKINKVNYFLNSIKKDDVDLYSFDSAKQTEAKEVLEKGLDGASVFDSDYGKILRQLFNDFDSSPKYDLVRSVLREKGLTDADVNAIKIEVRNKGFVSSNIVNEIANRNNRAIGKVLELVACDELSDRIVDINKDSVSKFRSASHLKGCLSLTNEQQTQKKIKLTEEQKYIRKYSGLSKRNFIAWLKDNEELLKSKNYDELDARQNEILKIVADRNPKEQISISKALGNKDSILDDFKIAYTKKDLKKNFKESKSLFKLIKKGVREAGKQTPEYQVTNWKRNLFPITKMLGAPIKMIINHAQDKVYYHGDLLKAHKKVLRLERKTKLKHADVYCENGTGFRKIRDEYKLQNVNDFVVDYNSKNKSKVPNSFVCGYITDEKYFELTKKAALNACKAIQTNSFSKEVTGKNGKSYVATCYLDDPVVITVNGQNFDGEKHLPLATINVDQRQVLNATVAGILFDLAKDKDFQAKVNNITFTSGGRTRTIYVPQIKKDIEQILVAGSELFSKTYCCKMIENITRDEPFVRAYREGFISRETPKYDDEDRESEETTLIGNNHVEFHNPEAVVENNFDENSNLEEINDELIVANDVKEEELTQDDDVIASDDSVEEGLAQKDDEFNLLLLKRDLLNLKKKRNERLAFARKQLDLLEESNYSKIDEAKDFQNLENKLSEAPATSEAKARNEKLKAQIQEKLAIIAEKVGFTQEIVASLEQEMTNVKNFMKKIDRDIKNNAIENISEVRRQINEYKDEIENFYREKVQSSVVYIKNEKTGKTSNLYSRLNGEQRKKYSEIITNPRKKEEAKLNKELSGVEKQIAEEKKKQSVR